MMQKGVLTEIQSIHKPRSLYVDK